MTEARPKILIGQDNIQLTVPRKVLEGGRDLPIATKTKLGWMLHGPTAGLMNENHGFSMHVCQHDKNDEELHQLVKYSFSTDSFGVMANASSYGKSERRALEIMKNTTIRVGQRYETGLLWSQDGVVLPESKAMTFQRLRCTERKMDKDPVFADQYCKKMTEYEQKGYIRRLTPAESEFEPDKTWYLPHFGVTDPNKPGKLRLVFDAAAKSISFRAQI